MDDKPPAEVDQDDDELAGSDSGPLGTLAERSSSPTGVERTPETLNRPSHPSTAPADYAKGTREHDDDREG